jgi:hypothetical protein
MTNPLLPSLAPAKNLVLSDDLLKQSFARLTGTSFGLFRSDTTGHEIMRALDVLSVEWQRMTVLEGVKARRATAVTLVTLLPWPASSAARG